MYVGKIVDKHEGNFDWVLIAGALSPNYICVRACVCVCTRRGTVAVCCGVFNSCSQATCPNETMTLIAFLLPSNNMGK